MHKIFSAGKKFAVSGGLFFIILGLLVSVYPSLVRAENFELPSGELRDIVNDFKENSEIGNLFPRIRTSCSVDDESRDPSCGGLDETIVDADFTEEDNTDDDILGVNVFNTIQAGINATADNGSVSVRSGTYTEHVTIGRGIELSYDEGFFGENIGSEEGAPHIVAPDCTAVTIVSGEVQIGGFEIDGNDLEHECTEPLVDIQTGAFAILFFNTFENSHTALNVSTGTLSLVAFNVFTGNTVAEEVEGGEILPYHVFNYWGHASGPTASTNPGGHGESIIGEGASKVIFRMFVNTYPLAGEYPFSSATVSGDDVQDLFANGGSFWASFYDIHDTESVGVNEQVTVNIESDNGESSVFLDGFPSIFGPGYIFYDSEDENFDATDIRARSLNSREVSGVPDNRGVVGEVLQFGISGREMFIDDDVAIVTLEVEDARDGDDLYIYHSPTLKGGWTNEGLSSETCTVEDGLCVFETQTLSYFVATGKSVRRRTSGGSSGGGSVANTYTAQIIPTDTVPVENKSTSPIVKFLVNLKLKSAGEEVKTLQIFLNKNGFLVNTAGSGSLGQETNYFGPKTKAALILFQKAHTPLVADGVLGPKTVAVVNGLQ